MGNRRNRVRAILLRFDVDGDIQIVSASADDAYPGVSFTRTVAMMPGGIILDVCDLVSDSEHTYDWIYHNRGDFTTSLETRDLGGQLAEDSGYQNIQSVDVAETAHAWWASWVDEDAGIYLHTLGETGTEVFTGAGCGNPPPLMLPMVVVRRRTNRTRYISVLAPISAGAGQPQISLEIDDAGLAKMSSGPITHEFHLS